MKVLTSITILLTIPNIIFGFYGMNITTGLPLDHFWWIPLVVAAVVIVIAGVLPVSYTHLRENRKSFFRLFYPFCGIV